MIEARFVLDAGAPGAFRLDVDLRLPGAGVSVLFGPSGCGKTTLLRCLAGLQRAQQGRLVVAGQVWQDERVFVPPHRRSVGMVFQEASLFPHLSVQGNLDYGRQRAAAPQLQRALDEAVELLGIGALLPRQPHQLSGGERQRVAIARALSVAPSLLLMDEPLASLDAPRKAEILPFLERLQQRLTVPLVYVTHAVSELSRLADHVVLMEAGRVKAQGPLHELNEGMDLALVQDDEAGVVLACQVGQRDTHWGLVRLDFDGGALWSRDTGHALGDRVRVRVAARDVSLALSELAGTSIANQWSGVLRTLAPDVQPSQTLAWVQVGGVSILARLTRRSVERLQLRVGMPVWVQVKSVALLN
jgi:molybdate transport system ATP-binding protein